MARYIENLTTCSNPTSGDYFWIVDASAGATDKDRKVDVGLFPRLAVANTFAALQAFPAAGIGIGTMTLKTYAAGVLHINPSSYVLAAGAYVIVAQVPAGLVWIYDASSGKGALINWTNPVAIISGDATRFGLVDGAAGKINVFGNVAGVYVNNATASSVTLKVVVIG